MIKRIITVLLAIVMLLSLASAVFAENDNSEQVNGEETNSEKVNTDEEKNEKEKGKLSIASPYGILVDGNTGMVLFKKSASERVYPADLTKIMTAVLVLEIANWKKLLQPVKQLCQISRQGRVLFL